VLALLTFHVWVVWRTRVPNTCTGHSHSTFLLIHTFDINCSTRLIGTLHINFTCCMLPNSTHQCVLIKIFLLEGKKM
jgi:hypothetical protein